MSFRHSAMVATALVAISLVSLTAADQNAFAQDLGISITAQADAGSDTIKLIGTTTSDITDVTLSVKAPDGSVLVVIDQVTPDGEGNFESTFKINDRWTQDGFYTILASQGPNLNAQYSIDLEIEVRDGVAVGTSTTETNLNTGIIGDPEEPNVATPTGLELNEASFVNGSDEFTLSGMTDMVSQDIAVSIMAPNSNIITVVQISPSADGSFEEVIRTGGPLWKEDGFYTVTATQFDDPLYTASIQVDILDGTVVPEFGTIAAMILAAAIVSIIAVSARSRLSIVPRY